MNPVIAALATQRLTQLLVEDELTRPVRKLIEDWAEGAPPNSFKDRVAVLSSCPACMSVWSGGAIVLASRFPLGRVLVGVLAASSAALLVDGAAKIIAEHGAH